MCVIVRRIVRPFMSWSDSTPAPTVVGTPSYLAPVRRAEPNATSPEMPLWHLLGVFMTLGKAKSIARHLGLTLRQTVLRQLSRELPRWKRDHGLLHGQSRRRRQHRG